MIEEVISYIVGRGSLFHYTQPFLRDIDKSGYRLGLKNIRFPLTFGANRHWQLISTLEIRRKVSRGALHSCYLLHLKTY